MKRVYTRRPRAGVYNGIASSETVGICQEGSGPFSPPAREKCWNNRDEGDGLLKSWGSAGFGGIWWWGVPVSVPVRTTLARAGWINGTVAQSAQPASRRRRPSAAAPSLPGAAVGVCIEGGALHADLCGVIMYYYVNSANANTQAVAQPQAGSARSARSRQVAQASEGLAECMSR